MYLTIILILVILIMIAEKFLDNKNKENNTTNEQQTTNYSDKYKKKEYLLSKNELKFYRILKQITDNLGYSLFCQVSLYQLLKSDDFKDFNKIKSKSIDFVITQENCKILICIELDDNTHNQAKRIERDNFVNKLFKDLDIKLLRIPVQNYYNMEELEQKIKENL